MRGLGEWLLEVAGRLFTSIPAQATPAWTGHPRQIRENLADKSVRATQKAPPKRHNLGGASDLTVYGKYDGLTPMPMMKIRSSGESTVNVVATSPPG